jgi:hypothetical protein
MTLADVELDAPPEKPVLTLVNEARRQFAFR